MNEQESVHIFQRLTSMLDENGMGWVTQQVLEQIRIGKTIQREIETLKEGRSAPLFSTIDDYSSKLTRGPKVTFPVTIAYQPYEQLELLINAIKRAIVDTAEMEQHLMSFVQKQDEAPKRILFYADEPNSEPKPISADENEARYQPSKRLNELLESLRKEIGR
jgi:hypothetical protein